MIDLERWEEENREYLAVALERLRLLLEMQAERLALCSASRSNEEFPDDTPSEKDTDGAIFSTQSSQSTEQDTPQKASFFRRFFPLILSAVIDDSAAIQESVCNIQSDHNPSLEDRLRRAEELLAEAEKKEYPPALIILRKKLKLTSFECNLLFLCIAMELDGKIPQLCSRAQGDPSRPYPTLALAISLFSNEDYEALLPNRLLRHWMLIEIERLAEQPLIFCPLRADERITSYVVGNNYIDNRLAAILTVASDLDNEISLPPSQKAIVEKILEVCRDFRWQLLIIQLLGDDSPTKQMIAKTALREIAKTWSCEGMLLYRLSIQLLPNNALDVEIVSRLWQRESILLNIALYIDASDIDGMAQSAPYINLFLESCNGIVFFDIRERWLGLTRDTVSIDIHKPTSLEQRSTWASLLGSEAEEASSKLSSQFDLNIPTIEHIARIVLSGEHSDCSIIDELWHECRDATRPQVGGLAQPLDPKATWEDIVLPKNQVVMLHHISDQMGMRSKVYDDWCFRDRMNRGMGISVLFVGESGTGKTMAAEVLANDLNLDLYRIDLSAVISKYIGETEKNLKKVFDSMEGSGAILFFDEADALFGKRSEVKDSHDRYANIEVNYLLQRMEAYRGLAVLATNMKSALDKAFTRRLRFIVTFPFPGPAERKMIWLKAFPKKVPLTNLDYDKLARFNLTGGSIHNIALNAAFLAAKAGTSVSMSLLLESTKEEFLKLEMPINEADFIWPPEIKK